MGVQKAMPTILLATHNAGKLREFRALLASSGWEVLGLADLSIAKQVDENASSFAENARLKAISYSLETNLPVLADDSGLEVFALDGRPGVESARYAGAEASDADRIRKLLSELEHARCLRSARFFCALAMAQLGSLILEATGECLGEIAAAPRGNHGFGYDPVFSVPELGKTFAELDEAEKNRLSHRSRAVESLLKKMPL